MNRLLLLIGAAAAALNFAVSPSEAAYFGNAPWCAVVHRMGLRICVDRGLPAQRDRRQSRLLPNKSVLFARTALWCAARQAGASA
jgi:hypothetical protein